MGTDEKDIGVVVIGLYPDDEITIGDNIVIRYLYRKGKKISVGVRAPKIIDVFRSKIKGKSYEKKSR